MMQNITFTFPINTKSAQDFFKTLKALLAEAPNSESSEEDISFRASSPQGALPVVRLRADKYTNFPALRLDVDDRLDQIIEKSFAETEFGKPFSVRQADPSIAKTDALGTYYDVIVDGHTGSCLGISELQGRLKSHVKRIDHLGVNLPSRNLPRTAWENFVRQTSANCNLYKYPTGEDWPFVLPATIEEFETDITTFPIGRGPKFEFVYEAASTVPTFQFDIETDLSRAEIETVFPEPYGISFPGLADYFRTVYLHHEWGRLNIRFDVRFKSNKLANPWSTGEWLVKKGGRIDGRD